MRYVRFECIAALALVACHGDDSALRGGPGYDASSPADGGVGADGGSDAAASSDGAPLPGDAGRDAPAPLGRTMVYVGSDDGNVYVYELQRSTSALSPMGHTAAGSFPSWLAFDLARGRVFATNENAGAVAALTLDAKTGALTANGAPVSAGGGTTHVSIDASGAWVLAANYGGGSFSVLPVKADGSLGAPVQTAAAGTNPHWIATDGAGTHAFVVEKGSDRIGQYDFDAAGGKLTPNASAPSLVLPAGSGPRHLAFHPDGAHAYLIDESDSTMRALAYDAQRGTFSTIQALSTLPQGFSGTNTGAEVQIARSGKVVYGSNRGDDSIVAFAIDPQSGMMTFASRTPTGGTTPRHFSLDEADGLLLVANQGSKNVVVFRVDATGALTKASTTGTTGSPYFVQAVQLP